MSNKILLQEPLLPGYVPNICGSDTKKKEKTSGSRINPSQLEYLSTMYIRYSQEGKEPSFSDLDDMQQLTEEDIIENAHWSMYGTQAHSLQYFTQLFHRASRLGRLPTFEDFQSTFLQRDPNYYYALLKVQELTDMGCSNSPLDVAQQYWITWIQNGQDFTPKKHKNYTIPPSTIQSMWEGEVMPLEDIHTFRRAFKDSERLDPQKSAILNETFLLTNIYFPDGSIQVPTLVDEICISRDFNEPINIIDYKSGKQFKEPSLRERAQIFLIMTSVLANVLDRVPEIEWNDMPTFKGKKGRKKLISGIFFDELTQLPDIYTERLRFRYINPITQEEILVTAKNLGIDTKEGIEEILMYIRSILSFYTKYKHILKYRMDSSRSPYTLPSFPIKNFTSGNGSSKAVQIPLL